MGRLPRLSSPHEFPRRTRLSARQGPWLRRNRHSRSQTIHRRTPRRRSLDAPRPLRRRLGQVRRTRPRLARRARRAVRPSEQRIRRASPPTDAARRPRKPSRTRHTATDYGPWSRIRHPSQIRPAPQYSGVKRSRARYRRHRRYQLDRGRRTESLRSIASVDSAAADMGLGRESASRQSKPVSLQARERYQGHPVPVKVNIEVNFQFYR